jgi:hypothetical protein
VAAGIKVSAADGEVVALNPLDDRRPDPGPLADLLDGETRLAPRFREFRTDAHCGTSAV